MVLVLFYICNYSYPQRHGLLPKIQGNLSNFYSCQNALVSFMNASILVSTKSYNHGWL